MNPPYEVTWAVASREATSAQLHATKGKHGTGIGLLIGADILTSSGSALLIDTTLGAGTKVTIAWPAQAQR